MLPDFKLLWFNGDIVSLFNFSGRGMMAVSRDEAQKTLED
jgi:hypothetical protein